MAIKHIILVMLFMIVVAETSNPPYLPHDCGLIGCPPHWIKPKKGLDKRVLKSFVAKKHFGRNARSKRSVVVPIPIE